ncbi:uncharacterized protein DUF932 [Lentzea atacamensis]|uniref:Uncharacterized protein DUF932 n=1 Tax=Lentzea atacamensis TaxID=531938 RepID=A0A316HY51_9PSEU|nr:DUF932 domain-containing protein [Lentzea atacamensis]PWK83204.1 uncharacterized protein DUF932 [Lentzea atacamensis]
MTTPVDPAQKTPAAKPAAKAAAKPVAAKPAAKATKAPTKAPAKTPAAKAPAQAPAKPAAAKAPADKSSSTKAAPAKAPAAKAPAAKGTPAKAETKAKPVAVEPIKPGKDAWARLATAVNGSRSVNELLKKAQLSEWNVKVQPAVVLAETDNCTECEAPAGEKHKKNCLMLADVPNDTGLVDAEHTAVPLEMDNTWGLVRPHPDAPHGRKFISSTTSNKVPVPIEVRGEMLASIMKETKAKTGPAGPLWNDKAAFASIRVPEQLMVGGKDPVEFRVVVISSLVSARSSKLIISPVRVATQTVHPVEFLKCPNHITLTAADDADKRITETSSGLDLLHTYTQWFTEAAESLFARTLTADEFSKFCNTLFPYPGDTGTHAKRTRHQMCINLMRILFEGRVDITKDIAGTAWGALTAALTVFQQFDPETGDTDTDRAMTTLFADKNNPSKTAWQLARRFVS